MNRRPLVTVGIPTYNRTKYLAEAIQSVLEQTFEDFEFLIYDNASTEDVAGLVQSFDDPRINYVRHSRNVGPLRNSNLIAEHAKGKYVVMHHDDDIMLPTNLEKKAAFMEANQGVGFVHSGFERIDMSGRTLPPSLNANVCPEGVEPGWDMFRRLLRFNPVGCPTVMISKEAIVEKGLFDESVAVTADIPAWMKFSLFYDIGYLAEPLLKIRLHPGQDSAMHLHGYREAEQLYSSRLRVLRDYEGQFGWLAKERAQFQRRYFMEVLREADELSWNGNAGTVLGKLFFVCSRCPWLALYPSTLRASARSLGRSALRQFRGRQV